MEKPLSKLTFYAINAMDVGHRITRDTKVVHPHIFIYSYQASQSSYQISSPKFVASE